MILNTNMKCEKIFAMVMSAVGLIFCIVGFAGTVSTAAYTGTVTVIPLPVVLVGMIFSLIGLSYAGAIGSKGRWTPSVIISFCMGLATFVANLYLTFTAAKFAVILHAIHSIF